MAKRKIGAERRGLAHRLSASMRFPFAHPAKKRRTLTIMSAGGGVLSRALDTADIVRESCNRQSSGVGPDNGTDFGSFDSTRALIG